MGRVLVPNNQAKLSKYIGEGEGNMSTSIRAPCTKYFWKFLRHIRTFLDYLGDVDPPVGRVLAPNNQAKLNKYMGEWGGQYLSFYKGSIHQIVFGSF